MKRVVVTGLGIVSCIGNTKDEVSNNLMELNSGIVKASEYEEFSFRSLVHGKPNINKDGGNFSKGEIVAELDIKSNLWFFDCHFKNDPVMPGCLGLDAMWQLVGFYLGWLGQPGKGRALGVGEVKFTGQVLQTVKKVTYHISLKRLILRKLIMGVADGILKADGKTIYEVKDMKVGLFAPK